MVACASAEQALAFHVGSLAAAYIVWFMSIGQSGYMNYVTIGAATRFSLHNIAAMFRALGQNAGIGAVLPRCSSPVRNA